MGETCDVLQLLPRDKLADTLLVLGFKYTPDRYFILYQLEIGDVYAKFAQRSMSGEYVLEHIYIKFENEIS